MINSYFSIGPIQFHYYGLIIAVAIYIGLYLAQKRAKHYKIPEKLFNDPIVIIPLILMLAGGRIYHVMDKWTIYSQNFISIFYISNGGLGIWGALFGLVIGLHIVCRIKKIKYLTLLDAIAPSVLLAQAIGRAGNYINQEGFGPPTERWWGVFIEASHRPAIYQNFSHFHPTFFYEAILDAILFFTLITLSKRLKEPGQIFGMYLVFYAISRFSVEYFRIDTWQVGQTKVAQLLSLVTFLIGTVIVLKNKKKGLDIN